MILFNLKTDTSINHVYALRNKHIFLSEEMK